MRKKTKIFTGFGLSLLMIAVLMGCSTSKNTFPNRAYHNVTCRYNVYWNGNQAMKDAEREYAKLRIKSCSIGNSCLAKEKDERAQEKDRIK